MSALGNTILFLADVGLYDVVLPFLLVFTIIFALFEKTLILGYDELDGKKFSKKNLNAMVAFVMGFLVIASTELVRIINTVLANTVLLVILGVMFLLLVGSVSKQEEVFLDGNIKYVAMGFMFIGIMVIFFYALGWLDAMWLFARSSVNGQVTSYVVALFFFIGMIALITSDGNRKPNKEKK